MQDDTPETVAFWLERDRAQARKRRWIVTIGDRSTTHIGGLATAAAVRKYAALHTNDWRYLTSVDLTSAVESRGEWAQEIAGVLVTVRPEQPL